MKKFILLGLVMFSTLLAQEPVRVYVDVVGDLFHAGHIAFFKKAKEQGDVLIVGIHSDKDVEKYKRTPILTMNERAAVIAGCKYVDEIVLNAPVGVTEELLLKHKIDLVIHGDDFNEETVQEQYGVPMDKGIFQTVPYTEGISTSDIINRIKNRD